MFDDCVKKDYRFGSYSAPKFVICGTKLRKHLIVLATGRFCYSKVEVLHHLDVLDNFF